jgi:hypothetical protein
MGMRNLRQMLTISVCRDLITGTTKTEQNDQAKVKPIVNCEREYAGSTTRAQGVGSEAGIGSAGI